MKPPNSINNLSTSKQADFFQYGYNEGPLYIECKNYREWLYPNNKNIKELIINATDLDLIPVMIARRIHYTTLSNFFKPAGIIAHESYYQYYPSDQAEIANQVSHKRFLGFTDVRATEEPDPRTRKFISRKCSYCVTGY